MNEDIRCRHCMWWWDNFHGRTKGQPVPCGAECRRLPSRIMRNANSACGEFERRELAEWETTP